MDGELPPWTKHGSHNSRVPYNTAGEHLEDQELDQGNCNWTSVIKDALEMTNGEEMEQTLSMDVRAPLMDFNTGYKGPDTEAINDHYRIAEPKLIENQDGQRGKGEPDTFISVLSDDISTKKDVLVMGKNEKTSSLDVGSSMGKEELGLTEFNRSLYAPFSSSDSLIKGKAIPSFEPTFQTTKGCERPCKDVSPRKHSKVNNKTVHGSTSVYGPHRLDPRKVTDGTASVKSLDHSSEHDAQVSETMVVTQTSACLPNTLCQNTALVKYEISKEGTSESSPSINTNDAELGLKVEAKFAPEIPNSSETVPDQPVEINKSHIDFKCKDSQKEQRENRQVNELCLQENNTTPERTTDKCEIHVQEKQTLKNPSGAKGRKRKKTELELLFEPIYNKKDNCPMYESDTPGATRCEEVNKNTSLADHASSALKEEDLVANGDANPPSSKRKSCLRVSQLEPVTDTAETSDHICSEATQEKVRINRKKGSKRKRKKRRRNSVTLDSQCLSQSTVLSPSHSKLSNTTFVKEGSNVAVTQDSISSLESSIAESSSAEAKAKSPKKSLKKKMSDTENVANELLNPCFESINTTEADASVVQPTIRRFRARKTPDTLNREPAQLNELNSTAESVSAEESDYSGVRRQKTEMTPSKRRKTKTKYMEAQTSPSEDLASTVVVNQEKTVKSKMFSINKTNDLNSILLEKPSLLSAETQENSISKTDSSSGSSSTLKKTRKAANKIKEEAEEMIVTQHDGSQMALKEEKPIKKTVRQNVENKNVTALTTQRTERVSASIAHSTSRKCKKMSDIEDEAVHTHIDDQTIQQEIHPFDPYAATEIDHFDGDYQKKTKRQVKRAANTNSKSEDTANKRIKKRTSFRNIPLEDHAEHPPISSGKDVKQSSFIKTYIVHETPESHVENQVSITTEVSSPSSQKKAKKTRRKQLFEQKEINVLEQANREDKMSDDIFKHIGQMDGFGNISSTEEKNIMVTQVQVFSKQPDDQIHLIKEDTRTTARKAAKTPKTKSQKSVRKMLTQTVKEEEIEADGNRVTDTTESHTRLVETLSTSRQTADCEDQSYVEQKPRKRGRPPLNRSTIFSDINECNTSHGERLTGEDQENVVQKRKRGRPPLKKSTATSDITECHIRLGEALSNPMQTIDCEHQKIVEQITRRRGRPLKNNKQGISLAHLEDNRSTSQDNIENTVKAVEVDDNVTVTEELGTDPSDSSQSATHPLSHSSPSPKRKNEKIFKKPKINFKLSTLRESSGTSKTSVKDFQKADMHFFPQSSTEVCSDEGKTSLSMPEVAENLKLCEKTTIQDGGVLADIEIENKATIEVVKGRKRGRKRRKIKQPSLDQSLISMQDCCEPVENVLTKLGVANERSTEAQNHIVTSEKSSVEMIPEIMAETCKRYKVEKRSAEQSYTENTSKRPKRLTKNKTIRSKPKEIVKKPLTCKYCGISFRHITAYTIHQRIHTGDKPYKCKICGKTFAQLSKLKTHRNVHNQDTSFPCPCCNRRFLGKEDLLHHFKVHLQESKANHEPQKRNANKYRCLICKENFVNQVKLQNHMRTHETEKALFCKDCGKKFWNPSRLAAHEKTHWPVKPYACSICGKGFNLLKALKKHSQDHAGETPFSCFHCGHAFSDLPALRMHQASKTCIARKNDETSGSVEGFIVSQGVDGQVNTPVFFKCQICKQLFRKWCQYTLHLQTHTSSPPYICFSCGQCYEKDSEMNVHCEACCQSSGEEKICGASLSEIMRGVTETYPVRCTSSRSLPSTGIQQNPQFPTMSEPVRTKDKSSTKHPINSTSTSSFPECVEINPSLWKFKCSRCGQRFKQYKSLGVHLQTHAPGFRYTCTHCGQFFERWSKLWLHQRHHGLKSRCYSCNQCNLQFRFYSSFKEHMIDHTGHRPYVCTLCPKTFIQEASLHAHQCESHKHRKSLKCDVCSKTFSSLTKLIKHSFLHNGSTSHICLSCNLPFTNSRLLKEHLKTHTTDAGPALPDIPLEPLSFPHKCKRCKASFSTGDLLYAHQICHSGDAKTQIRPAVAPTSKSSSNETPSTQRNHLSDLKLDSIPNDASLYLYSHPDKLYVPPSNKVPPPVINLDPDEQEASDSQSTRPELPNGEITSQSDSTASDSQNTRPELPNGVITSQSDSTASDSQNTRPKLPNSEITSHLPQAASDQETTNQSLSESIKEMADEEDNCSRKYKTRSTVVKRNVDMELETHAQQESEESFECADCTEKLTSVLSLYEHYILHALGDTYVH